MLRGLNWLKPYLSYNMLIVALHGFSSGVPLLLVGGTLGAWLQDAGVDKATIGLFALVALPYSFNFLWAPFMDHVRLPILTRVFGRRRGWLLLTQSLLIGAILLQASNNPLDSAALTAIFAVLIAFLSASQDVVIDAYRTDILKKTEYGAGATIAVFGYRLGMLATGAGALALADMVDWQLVYMVMAGCMAVGILATLFAREPEVPETSTLSEQPFWQRVVVAPFKDFMQRYPHWLLLLLFIFCYRLPDGFIAFMTTPFFLDIGFEKTTIATIAKLYGFGATLLGMFVGGVLLGRWNIMRCLWVFGVLQIITNVTYVTLALSGPLPELLMAAVAMDNLSGGMVTAAAVAYIMSLCNHTFTATQYALLSSLASLASKTIAGWAGVIADAYGWPAMFALSGAMGIPALILLFLLRSADLRNKPNAQQRD